MNENYIISKEDVSKYPIFECMINRFISKKPDKYFLQFCSLMRLLNSNAYEYMCDMLPFYSITSCKYFIRPLKQTLTEMIQDPSKIMILLKMFYDQVIEFDNDKAKEKIFITLGGDAASLKPSFVSSNNAVYAYICS